MSNEMSADTLLLLNEAISLGRRDGMASQHLDAMCSARDEIIRLQAAINQAYRIMCSGKPPYSAREVNARRILRRAGATVGETK